MVALPTTAVAGLLREREFNWIDWISHARGDLIAYKCERCIGTVRHKAWNYRRKCLINCARARDFKVYNIDNYCIEVCSARCPWPSMKYHHITPGFCEKIAKAIYLRVRHVFLLSVFLVPSPGYSRLIESYLSSARQKQRRKREGEEKRRIDLPRLSRRAARRHPLLSSWLIKSCSLKLAIKLPIMDNRWSRERERERQ